MVGLLLSKRAVQRSEGLRPVNLRTDLAPLADLIELVFSGNMDSNGRAAIREMRYLSKMGVGLKVLAGVNELAQGISLGYVWIADGKLIGNVSVYPTRWPFTPGRAWIIANVAVHPDYQRRGIATRLMQASMEMIREHGGRTVVLQVDAANDVAQRVYERLGFVSERTWTYWKRKDAAPQRTIPPNRNIRIDRRRRGEWRAEYALAQQIRPRERGGLGWLAPLHPGLFRTPGWKALVRWLSLNRTERLVIRSADENALSASIWVEREFAAQRTKLTLMVAAAYQGVYDEALIGYVVRRFGRGQPLIIEHPADEQTTNDVLRRYHFHTQRTVVNMRWDVSQESRAGRR